MKFIKMVVQWRALDEILKVLPKALTEDYRKLDKIAETIAEHIE